MSLAVGLASVAEARLGETLPQLIARFGEAVRPGKSTVFVAGNPRAVGELFIFRYDEWRIDAFMIDNLCARIRYTKSEAWTDQQIAELLALNAKDLAWKEEPPAGDRRWTRTDGATATWNKAAGLTLELPLYAERVRDRAGSSGAKAGSSR